MLLDPDLIKGQPHTSGQEVPPAFRAVLYGTFTGIAYNLCRVENKLYSFSDDFEVSFDVSIVEL